MNAAVGAREPFPWETVMGVGLGLLRLSPDAFWAMTPREFAAAAGLTAPARADAPERDELARLMAEFPD